MDPSDLIVTPSKRINNEPPPEVLTADDIVQIKGQAGEIALFNYLNEAGSLVEFNKRVDRILKACGLRDWSHMLYEETGWIHESAGTIPKGNRDTYLAEGLHHFDLMLQHAKRCDTPVLQSTINNYVNAAPFEHEIFERNKVIARLMAEYGYPEYFNVPLSSACKGARAIFSVGVRGCNAEKVRKAILRHDDFFVVLARAVDYVGCMRFDTHFPNTQDPVITDGPLRLLQAVLNTGCEIQEAAPIIGVKPKTAYNYSRAACTALGVNNFAAALVIAEKRKLIIYQPNWQPPVPGSYSRNQSSPIIIDS